MSVHQVHSDFQMAHAISTSCSELHARCETVANHQLLFDVVCVVKEEEVCGCHRVEGWLLGTLLGGAS